MQNQAKNSAFNHRFYNLFSDILSSAVFKQAYRLGQLAFPQVGGWFTQNSAIDNTKVKTEDNFVENRNLKTKTELFTSSFLRQIYRFGQLAKLQVGGWFARNSASKKAQALIKNSIQGTRNVRSVGQMRRKFLTTCTIKGTQGGNLQADVPQYGRSMIEMLGVLAIIGVLSVGGIAGYTKAMETYKINKILNDYNHAVFAVLEKGLATWKSINGTIEVDVLSSIGAWPDTWNATNSTDILGNKWEFWIWSYPYNNQPEQVLSTVIDLKKNNEGYNQKFCQSLFNNVLKVNSAYLHSFAFWVESLNDSGHKNTFYGDKICSQSAGNCIRDLTPVKIQQLCAVCTASHTRCRPAIRWSFGF